MPLSLQPLTPESFAPFGRVLRAPKAGPREDHAATVENDRPATARANLALIAAAAARFPLELNMLERHSQSTQTFLPLDVREYLVVVCLDDGHGRPDMASLIAFRVDGRTGIHYHRGTWHHAMTTIGEPGVFAMLVHEDGTPDDCQFVGITPVNVG